MLFAHADADHPVKTASLKTQILEHRVGGHGHKQAPDGVDVDAFLFFLCFLRFASLSRNFRMDTRRTDEGEKRSLQFQLRTSGLKTLPEAKAFRVFLFLPCQHLSEL